MDSVLSLFYSCDDIVLNFFIGPNSLRILKEIGVFDDVYKKSGETTLNMFAYRYISGMEGHEVLFEVCTSPSYRL